MNAINRHLSRTCWKNKELPIDRHDWYVDRCGREVRYVIDYYFHEDKAGQPGQFDLVVRPAADSVESAGVRPPIHTPV